MEIIRIGIAEDEERQRLLLLRYLERIGLDHGEKLQIQTYQSCEELLKSYKNDYHILLLDIQMGHVSGMEAAEKIRALDKGVIIIFITNLAQYALQGYSVSAMGFLVKPINYSAIEAKILQAIKKIKKREGKMITLKSRSGPLHIDSDRIRYVEIVNRKLIIHMQDGIHQSYEPLKKLEERLDKSKFARCHVAYLVNMNFIDRIDNNTVYLGGDKVMISNHRKKVCRA